MRYRLRTLLLILIPIAISLAWWRDHWRLNARLDLQSHQIRTLQDDLANLRGNGIPVAMKSPFQTAEEALEFFKSCKTEADLNKVSGWVEFVCSSVADETAGPLPKAVVDLPGDDAICQRAIWLVGAIGQKKRPLPMDPVPELIALLDHPRLAIRGQARDSLGKFGSLAQPALPRLRQIMLQDLKFEALFAVDAVKEINPSEEVGPLLRSFYFSKEADLRLHVPHRIAKFLPPEEARQFLAAQYEQATERDLCDEIVRAMNEIKE